MNRHVYKSHKGFGPIQQTVRTAGLNIIHSYRCTLLTLMAQARELLYINII